MSILSVGITGLNAAQAGLTTASHNIANVNTAGYSRQTTVQTTATPYFTGAGFVGNGANVQTITRNYSSYLDVQAREALTQSTQADELSKQLANIDQMFSDPSAGLSPALDDFYKSINTVSTNPADAAARQTMVSAGEVLATRFRDMYTRLEALRSGVNDQVNLTVGAVNLAASQIAGLNDKITQASGQGNQPPNDLLDQRDALLRDLSRELRVTAVVQPNGSANVFLANGEALVLDARSFTVGAQPDPSNAANLRLGMLTGSNFRAFDDSAINGGALGGAITFRNQALDIAENALGRVAGAYAEAFNAQHAMGQDRSGAAGGNFFSVPGPAVQASALNTGSGVMAASVASYQAVTTSDYRVSYNGTNYTVTRLSDRNQQTFASLPQTIDGVTLSLSSGTPAAGDSFLVQPTRAAASGIVSLVTDPARIAAALPVRASTNSANLGSASLAVGTVTPPAGANLAQPVTITFTSATTFNVTGTGTGNPTGLAYTPGMTLSYNGWSAQLKGTPMAGDTFAVGPNTNGAGDNGNLLALAGLSTSKLLAGGTLSVGEAYALAVSDIGSQARTTAAAAKAQQAVLTQATNATQEVSGVNLDEEASNLLKYQQAYQAAGKVMATANTLFQDILNLMR
jgi:flagellar hook-associated protein 1 FlgK